MLQNPIEHLLISCNLDKASLIENRSFNEWAAQDSPTLTREATHSSPLKAMLFLFLLLLSSQKNNWFYCFAKKVHYPWKALDQQYPWFYSHALRRWTCLCLNLPGKSHLWASWQWSSPAAVSQNYRHPHLLKPFHPSYTLQQNFRILGSSISNQKR